MSKSGLFAHFGSKEELQLATIGAAEEIFAEDVLRPALEAEGLERVRALSERFLSHVGRNVFPGGCFFASAAAELDTRPGPVRERVVAVQRQWMDLFEGAIRTAQERRELDPSVDPAQLTFELNALLGEANGLYLLERRPRRLRHGPAGDRRPAGARGGLTQAAPRAQA